MPAESHTGLPADVTAPPPAALSGVSLCPLQGRLPVRWMAIESLNYSVYTTNSDV